MANGNLMLNLRAVKKDLVGDVKKKVISLRLCEAESPLRRTECLVLTVTQQKSSTQLFM